MKNQIQKPILTVEDLIASIKETDRVLSEKFAETYRLIKESERNLDEKFAETDRQMQETDRQMQKTARGMEKLQELMGNWANNHGSFAEEYFLNAFERGQQNFFGEKFDHIQALQKSNLKKFGAEYDIAMYNHSSVALVEVKFKAHINDIPKVLKKAEIFRKLFPVYKDYKIYLGLASLSFYKELEQECIHQGIAVIKQVGDTVVISDENLRAF
jgi:hypothetical protein